jgi:signal transduction histidine kinase
MSRIAPDRAGKAPDSRRHVSSGSIRGALVGSLLLFLTLPTHAAPSAAAPRQVLVLQSMDRGSLVFDTVTADFRAALLRRLGTSVTLFDFVVVPAGLTATPREPVIDYLQSIYSREPPELIVTIGGPAAAFARSNRQQLFPQTPVLFAAVEERFLGDRPLGENETSVTVSIDYPGVIEDILRLLPETRNVFFVMGSGPVAAFWQTELQRNFDSFGNRLTFIWSQDLSYEQTLQRAESLPPHSAIFYLTAGTFATGSWQGDEKTLADLSARANAPIFGALSPWLGAGVVGGRLLDLDDIGDVMADVVVRILNGESPGSIRIPPKSRGPGVFDARLLRRWNIDESRLPPGSDVRFRNPSLWRDYRDEVLGALAVLSLQALLIVGLLYQRRARHRAEAASRRHLTLAADANRRITIAALTSSMVHELSQPLASILNNAEAAEMMMASNRSTPELLREILADIRTADARATDIVNRYRAMLRHRELETEQIDIHAVVRDSLTFLAHDTKRRQIQVDVDLAPVPCIVIGDQVLLQQVVVNLMMNAMDAMVETAADRRRITVSDVVGPGSVKLSVRDAGTGLPAGSDGTLFQPFVTTKATGIGIGLTIVRTIVEAHGGRIDAHNNDDRGATFTVTLPCNEVSTVA